MQPMNYILDVKNPFDSALRGVQAGIGINTAMDQANARTQELQQKQYTLEQQKAMQMDLGALSQNPNPTAQDFAAITTKYPQLAEHFKNTWSMLNTDQQQTRLSQASQIYSALHSGNPEIAQKLADNSVTAYRNSGDNKNADVMEAISKTIAHDPNAAKTATRLLLSSVMGPEKFASTFSTLEKLPSEIVQGDANALKAKYEALNTPARLDLENRYKVSEVRNLESQIGERAGRLGLDKDKLQTETELKLYELNQKNNTLPEYLNKDLSESVTASISAQQSAAKMSNLAEQITKADLGGGITALAGETWKKTFGSQNELTRIRSEYSRIVTPAAMAAYKQVASGSTSDKDIETAMVGVPKDTDSSERLASFLRGAAKLQVYESVMHNAKAEWLGAVQGLGKNKTDIVVDGVTVPAGTTFKQFTDSYIPRKVAALNANQEQAAIPQRSYMRHAQGAQ